MSRKGAKQLLANVDHALADMKQELADAKQHAAGLFPDANYDVNNPKDMAVLKSRYQSSLKVHVIDDPSSQQAKDLMKRMYGLYEKIFPLEDEREEYDKLLELMGKNHDATLQATGAPFKEQWIVVEDADGTIVAARNTITFAARAQDKLAAVADGTQHLIYGFVDPKHRSLGLGDFTMAISEHEARKFIGANVGKHSGKVDFVQISEQNAPLKMSMEATLIDTAGAKTDQFWRRHYYESLGFRELEIDYIQLPLAARCDGGEACYDLNLITRGVPAPEGGRGMARILDALPAAVARFHLYNFFDRSVAAGQYDVEADQDWITMSGKLQGGDLKVKPKLDFLALQKKTMEAIRTFVNGNGKFDGETFSDVSIGEFTGVAQIPPANDNRPAAPSAQQKSAFTTHKP